MGPEVDSASNINEYHKIFLGGKERSARKADKFIAIWEPLVQEIWDPRHLINVGVATACYRDSFTLLLFNIYEQHAETAV
jgi:hypothetical protein